MINRVHSLQNSFAAKVIMILVVTMVCMAVLFDFLLISMQKKTYQTSHSNQNATLVRMFAHMISLEVFVENEDDLLVSVEGLMLQEDVVEVLILGQEGQLLLQKTKDPTGRFKVKSKEIQAVLGDLDKSDPLKLETKECFICWSRVFLGSSSNTEDSWYFDGEDRETDQEVVGYVAVVISKKLFTEGVRNIIVQTCAAVLIFLFIGIFLTFFIIQRLTEPLRDLMLLIRKSTGDTTITGPGNLGVITETYGSMIEDLEKSFATITELKDGLEEKVEQRTEMLAMANEELASRQVKLEVSNTNLSAAHSSLQNTQEQLIQKEKLAAMGQLVAGVAHEINNSVNFVSGALPSLHRCLADMRKVIAGYESIEKARGTEALDDKFDVMREIKEEVAFDELFSTIDQLMENMNEGTRRTTRIINDLKIFSRENAEKMGLINLNVLIDSTVDFIDKKMQENIEIIRDYGAIPNVFCLPGRMSQVFLNIINNAIQAMDGNGQLTIKTRHKKEHVHIFFSDTGCGIAKDHMSKIFDPFFTSKEVGKGTGLGLGISYTIIRQHGGIIKVQSEEGKGSVFEVVLPLEPKDSVRMVRK